MRPWAWMVFSLGVSSYDRAIGLRQGRLQFD